MGLMKPTSPTRRPNVLLLGQIRRWHTYLSVLIAPSLIFFAATGAAQLFSLHEAHGAYTPPAWLESAASLHKDQTLRPHHKPPGPPPGPKPDSATAPAQAGPPKGENRAGPPAADLALKWVWLATAVAVIVSAGLGLAMALMFSAERRLLALLAALGLVLPVVLAIAS